MQVLKFGVQALPPLVPQTGVANASSGQKKTKYSHSFQNDTISFSSELDKASSEASKALKKLGDEALKEVKCWFTEFGGMIKGIYEARHEFKKLPGYVVEDLKKSSDNSKLDDGEEDIRDFFNRNT